MGLHWPCLAKLDLEVSVELGLQLEISLSQSRENGLGSTVPVIDIVPSSFTTNLVVTGTSSSPKACLFMGAG